MCDNLMGASLVNIEKVLRTIGDITSGSTSNSIKIQNKPNLLPSLTLQCVRFEEKKKSIRYISFIFELIESIDQ